MTSEQGAHGCIREHSREEGRRRVASRPDPASLPWTGPQGGPFTYGKPHPKCCSLRGARVVGGGGRHPHFHFPGLPPQGEGGVRGGYDDLPSVSQPAPPPPTQPSLPLDNRRGRIPLNGRTPSQTCTLPCCELPPPARSRCRTSAGFGDFGRPNCFAGRRSSSPGRQRLVSHRGGLGRSPTTPPPR